MAKASLMNTPVFDGAPFVRTPFNYDRDEASIASGLACQDPSRTQQNFAEESDINTIVKRFNLTGELPSNFRAPQYGDFDGIADYQSALNQVMAANDAFMSMPAGLRARFHNNPQNLIEFLSREENRDEAVRLGLLQPPVKVPATPPQGEVVEPPVGGSGKS